MWWESRIGLGCIFRQWHCWSMTDEWWLNLSQRLDLPLEIIKAKLVLSEFFGLFIMEMERPITIALVLPGNRFYGLESVSFSFFSSARSITELFILLLCTRKTHLESECIGIQSLVEVSVTSGKKFIMYFLWCIIWFWMSCTHGNKTQNETVRSFQYVLQSYIKTSSCNP